MAYQLFEEECVNALADLNEFRDIRFCHFREGELDCGPQVVRGKICLV